jgi:hypothetical protein
MDTTTKLQKDVAALTRIAEALIDRMENIEQALAISKGATGIKVQKASATNSWPVNGARTRLAKGAAPVEKAKLDSIRAAVRKAFGED